MLCIRVNELLYYHVSATHTDDQLAIENLGVNLPRPENVVAIPKSLDRHRAVSLMDILANHLVKQVPLGQGFRGSRLCLLCGIQHGSEALLKLLDDAFLVPQEAFHLGDLLVAFGNQCL